MKRQSYYKVPADAYLFREVLGTTRSQVQEEPVRQWCAFELIRAYGIPIANLRFEWPVKLGSRGLRADIVVLREERPWILVECKKLGHSLHDKARDQGLGYADSAAIGAPFFLYTNGKKWLAYHKVKDLWTAVDNLPLWGENEPSRKLDDILDSIYSLKPIVYKLDEPVAGYEGECFLEHLQRFFVHSNTLLRSVDEKAIEGADHLLRALLDKTQHLNYRVQKLTFAFRDWEAFRERRGIGRKIEVADFDGRMRPFLSAFHYSLDSLLPHLVRPPSIDALVLRLCVALLAYGVTSENGKEAHIPMTQAVHQTLRDLLNAVLSEKFQCQLPDIVDRDANSRVKGHCQSAWDEYIEGGKLD